MFFVFCFVFNNRVPIWLCPYSTIGCPLNCVPIIFLFVLTIGWVGTQLRLKDITNWPIGWIFRTQSSAYLVVFLGGKKKLFKKTIGRPFDCVPPKGEKTIFIFFNFFNNCLTIRWPPNCVLPKGSFFKQSISHLIMSLRKEKKKKILSFLCYTVL